MDLVVIGAGGHAKVIIATALAAGHNVVAILDDDPARIGTSFEGEIVQGPVLGALRRFPETKLLIAIGDNHTRAQIASKIDRTFASLIHPFSWVAPDAVLGEGTVILAGSIVQPGVRIGRHCVLNTASSIDHSCTLEDFCHVAPGARLAGEVILHEGAFVGMGASIIQTLEVGPWSTIGAGAAVIRNVPENATVKGVPAR